MIDSEIHPEHQDLKFRLHHKLLDRINLEVLAGVDDGSMRGEVREELLALVHEEPNLLTGADKQRIAEEVLDEVFGLGPLQALLQDPAISDILVNGPKQVYVERKGLLEPTTVRFRDDGHLLRIIDRIVSHVGRRVDESNPMVDARLKDGSRVNAIIPPLAVDGPLLSIRRFGNDKLMPDDLVNDRFAYSRHEAAAGSGGPGAAEHRRVRRNRRREDHFTQCPLRIHFSQGEDCDHRRRSRAATEATPPRAPRNAARESRRPGRRAPAPAPDQYSPHASRSHHRRRGARRRSARHVTGHEHRPRRFPHHHSRQ